MDSEAYHGTLTSKLAPIVTMLTDALVKDFVPAYQKAGKPYPDDVWIRTDEDGTEMLVSEDQLKKDVGDWLLGLEHELEDENDRQFAKMCAHMIRKNPGWIALLTQRVKKRIG